MSSVTTYYFDGHIDVSDPDNVWTDDNNAHDGNIATFAYSTTSSGGVDSKELKIDGTTAPTSGGAISSVRFRFNDSVIWSDYHNLSTPTGGWTWLIVSTLNSQSIYVSFLASGVVYIYNGAQLLGAKDLTTSDGKARISKIEIEVTHDTESVVGPLPTFFRT